MKKLPMAEYTWQVEKRLAKKREDRIYTAMICGVAIMAVTIEPFVYWLFGA